MGNLCCGGTLGSSKLEQKVTNHQDDFEDDEGVFDSGEGIFWGKRAAGAMLLAKDTGRLLVPRRSEDVMEPGTWGTVGGAIDNKEDPEKAARREIREELGYRGKVKMYPAYVFQQGTFRYYNFIGVVPEEFKPRLNWENDAYKWVKLDEMPKPLHFGLKALLRESEDLIKSLIDTRASIEPNLGPSSAVPWMVLGGLLAGVWWAGRER